ncbi:MAG: hypothetical protein ACLPKB_24555 [Xanthobacteraceae bacterium]
MMLRFIGDAVLAFIATASAAEQPEQMSGEGGGGIATVGQTLLLLILVVAGVAICLLLAWGFVRVLVHILVRIGVLPKPADRSGRWRILDYVDYAPAGVVTTSLFPLGTSAAAITGRLRPLDIDPRTGQKRAAHENGESGTT